MTSRSPDEDTLCLTVSLNTKYALLFNVLVSLPPPYASLHWTTAVRLGNDHRWTNVYAGSHLQAFL